MVDVLVALYADYRTADRVRTELVGNGFPTDRVELTCAEEHGRADMEPAGAFEERIVQYFGSLFASEEEHHYIDFFVEGVRRGHAAITVHPRGDYEVRSACEILQRHGPLDIDEHARSGNYVHSAERRDAPDPSSDAPSASTGHVVCSPRPGSQPGRGESFMQHGMHRMDMSRIERGLELAGGALLLLGALRSRSSFGRIAMGAAASGLLYSGMTGRAMLANLLGLGSGAGRHHAIHLVRTITIDRPADELYSFWRNFENLPRIMSHLESVRVLDAQRSRWRARGPLGYSVEWDAEVTHDVPNRELGWRSLPGANVDNSGIVRFEPSPLGRGTQLQVEMEYSPPAGRLGSLVARLFGEDPHQQVDDDLQNFKRMMEGTEIPTVGMAGAGSEARPM